MACDSQQKATVEKLEKEAFSEAVIDKDVQLIDVRTTSEYEAGHIGNAINYDIIDGDTFLKQIATLNKEEPVYLYCKMGGRSSRAAELLKKEGFTKIYDYSGGYNDWSSNE
ncbi:MAG: rhodanese-like domain-containing protein [Croceitalea sp.]|nr:rhodanese-like domain-containing protein [Croceitalea sp.]NNC33246.1 rhodanese-like domain-containing protein [Croceitalea sp.]